MSKFLGNIVKLSSATLIGQVLGIILTPVLSRLYSPADFGTYQLFFSIVTMIAVISCFSYYSAIILPKKNEDAAHIVVLCFFLIGFTTIFTTIFFLFFSDTIMNILEVPGFDKYIFLLPFGILFNSVAYVLNFWLARREEFTTIAKANVYSSITSKGISIGSGIISPSPFGLILGAITNDATIVIVCLKRTFEDCQYFRNISFNKIKDLAHLYKKFPIYSSGSDLASNAANMVIPFMLTVFFSPIIVGYYAMSFLAIKLPSKVIGNSLVSVFYQKASAEKNLTGNIKDSVKAVHSRLISIGLFACLVMIIIGPELFTFVLGNQWYTAGVYAQIFAPWFFVAFISIPMGSVLYVFEKQEVTLWFNISILISDVIVLYFGGLSGNSTIAIILLSATGIVFSSWINFYSLKIAGVSIRETISEIIRYLIFGIFVCLPLIVGKYFSISSRWLMVITIIVTIVYYVIIIHQDTRLKEGLINSIQKTIRR